MEAQKFSLILCTLGRDTVVRDFLQSLEKQNYKNFECIVVDQNDDDRLVPILRDYNDKMTIVHIRSKQKGLSVNRNIGITKASGQIIAFPDDDCLYDKTTLFDINDLINKTGQDIITINIQGIGTNSFFIQNQGELKLTRYNYRPYGISIGIFIKYRNKQDVHLDERLGVGQYFGADEESDLLSSLIEKGYQAEYHGEKYVYHPVGTSHIPAEKLMNRYRSYGLGYGALLKKEIIMRKKYRMIGMFLKDMVGRFIGGCLPIKKRKFYMVSAVARMKGFIEYKIEKES